MGTGFKSWLISLPDTITAIGMILLYPVVFVFIVCWFGGLSTSIISLFWHVRGRLGDTDPRISEMLRRREKYRKISSRFWWTGVGSWAVGAIIALVIQTAH